MSVERNLGFERGAIEMKKAGRRAAANLNAFSGRRSRSKVSTKNNGLPSGAIPNCWTDPGSIRHKGWTTT
jgi:hypothetical protein